MHSSEAHVWIQALVCACMGDLCGWTNPEVASKLSRRDVPGQLELPSGRRSGIFPTKPSGQDGHVKPWAGWRDGRVRLGEVVQHVRLNSPGQTGLALCPKGLASWPGTTHCEPMGWLNILRGLSRNLGVPRLDLSNHTAHMTSWWLPAS